MPARESRVVEYKAGGGNYTINILPTHINKYGSAFLNSSGGTLCIGVNDDGVYWLPTLCLYMHMMSVLW